MMKCKATRSTPCGCSRPEGDPGRRCARRPSCGSEIVDGIRTELETAEKLDRYFTVELKDPDGEVHAVIEKTINIRKRAPK